MTPPPGSYPDVSTPTTAPAPIGATQARQFTEPLRELSVLALLAGNAVFLFLGFSHLFLVIDGWASDFGLRCAQVFSTFVGPIGLGLPIGAMLLATHVAPMLRRTRQVMIVVLAELGVSALFGAITFLGGFAHDLSSARATIENTLGRIIWLGFLVLAAILATRLWMGLYPQSRPGAAGLGGYGRPPYGRPYPGQPLYPQDAPSYPAGTAPVSAPGQAGLSGPTQVTGWPVVPPPPMPGPLVMPTVDLTEHLPVPPPAAQPIARTLMDVPEATAPTSPASVQSADEQPVGDPSDDQPGDDQPGDDQPSDSQASDSLPRDDQPSESVPSEGVPSDTGPVSVEPTSDRSAVDEPTGEVPTPIDDRAEPPTQQIRR